MLSWKIAPALSCGNTVVLKSAEQTPLSALYLGNLVKEAGFPPGVINLISGLGKVAGAAMAGHMGVDKVAFTGSTATGRQIMKLASNNLKNITLECGGKSPLIIFEDADFTKAVKSAHSGALYNMGQVCTATQRIYVQEGIYKRFVEAFSERVKGQVIGSGFEENVFQGPQVSDVQQKRVLEYIESGKSEGATMTTFGLPLPKDGYYVQPTIFTNVTNDMRIVREEVFGPVAVIKSFQTEHEVVRQANDTSYGLAAALFTENITRGHRVAGRLQAGMVWINSVGDSHHGIPFGGYKSSGIGRELGEYALQSYSQAKAVHVNMT